MPEVERGKQIVAERAEYPLPLKAGVKDCMRKDQIKMTQPSPALTVELAAQLGRIALNGIAREYPTYPDHVLLDAADVRRTRELHPAFYGCFDWHSAVHTHWLLARLLRLLPGLPEDRPIRSALNEHLTEVNIRAEAAYFAQPGRRGFERPYGWTWLLKLAEELRDWDDPDARRWSAAIEPLARLIAELYLEFLPGLTYPIRSGTHSNTAFGLTFALDYAQATGHALLRDRIVARSLDYYGADKNGPAMWEPGGGDFLSPCLAEADLMRRVLPTADFAGWLAVFLPSLAGGGPPQLLTPALVSDRSDGQIVHLDGLNLSRAWCMWGIAAALPPDDRRRSILIDAAETHARAGLTGVGSGDYMGEHWLGSFALYMLGCAPQSEAG